MDLKTCAIDGDGITMRNGIRVSWCRQTNSYAIFLGGMPTRRKYSGGPRNRHIQVVVTNVGTSGKMSKRRLLESAYVSLTEMQGSDDGGKVRYYMKLSAAHDAIEKDPQEDRILLRVDMRADDPFPKGHGCWYRLSGDPERIVGVKMARGRSGPKKYSCDDLVLMSIGDAICVCPQGKTLEIGDPGFEDQERRRLEEVAKREHKQLILQRAAKRRRNEKEKQPQLALKDALMQPQQEVVPEPVRKKVRYVLFYGSVHGLTLMPYEEFQEARQQELKDFKGARVKEVA